PPRRHHRAHARAARLRATSFGLRLSMLRGAFMYRTFFARAGLAPIRRGALALVVLGAPAAALAQTTVTLQESNTRAWSATLRGGSYANTNLKTILETRSSDDLEYARRALLKFDTQNTIKEGTSVTKATLTITVKDGSDDGTRRIGVYQVTTS